TPFSMDAIHISEWFDYICDHYFAEFSFDRSQIEVQWSHNMVWYSGKTEYPTASSATIMMNKKLLEMLPLEETVETYIHEAIHAILHVTKREYNGDPDHGDAFMREARRIQAINPHLDHLHIATPDYMEQVNTIKKYHWKCSDKCARTNIPELAGYVDAGGWVSRARNKAPGKGEPRWNDHVKLCG
ncbi:hypothetical protein PRIPAC_87030, partial [Pristionchus pacificus]|uniref:SprT-like domain-containing protein n=1 Tax=Pristionchus pacificus TaxID=54126 RepID=A0A2A6BKK4_PRIPA